jgi:hypothetical protein
MVHAIEFHGRLWRSDGRPANPGAYDLLFRLHEAADADRVVWEGRVLDVPVAAGGFYHVLLGEQAALRPQLFADGPCWLQVYVLRDGKAPDPASPRIPLLGSTLRLGAEVDGLDGRVTALEARAGEGAAGGSRDTKRKLRVLHRRLKRLEEGGGAVGVLADRVAQLEKRMGRLDGEEGRVVRLEDELEDIVGPDGDVVDLTERVEALERRGIEPLALVPDGLAAMAERIEALQARLDAMEGRRADGSKTEPRPARPRARKPVPEAAR